MTINIWTLMLLFDLIKKMEISKASIAEIESPWWILLSRLKDFVVMTLLTRQYSWFLIRNPFKSILENAPQNHTSVKQLIRNCQPIQKLFQYLLLLGISSSYYLFPYFFAVSGISYISLQLSLMYLFFTYRIWLDEITSGYMCLGTSLIDVIDFW